jgi:hypothetical protein
VYLQTTIRQHCSSELLRLSRRNRFRQTDRMLFSSSHSRKAEGTARLWLTLSPEPRHPALVGCAFRVMSRVPLPGTPRNIDGPPTITCRAIYSPRDTPPRLRKDSSNLPSNTTLYSLVLSALLPLSASPVNQSPQVPRPSLGVVSDSYCWILLNCIFILGRSRILLPVLSQVGFHVWVPVSCLSR